jgi:hypothetical protein
MKVVSQGTKTFGEPTCLEPHTSGWNMLFETLKDINQHVGKKKKNTYAELDLAFKHISTYFNSIPVF